MTLTCEQSGELLTDLLAGEIAPESAEALDTHLGNCPSCREKAVATLKLDRALAELSAELRMSQTEAKVREALNRRYDPALAELSAEVRVSEADVGVREALSRQTAAARRLGRWRKWIDVGSVVAVALLVAVAVGPLWFMQTKLAPAIAKLEAFRGEAIINGQPAVEFQPIRLGDSIQTIGEESQAVIRFPDQTQIEIGPDSLVREMRDDDGKRIYLDAGYLRADVAKQPEGRPMVLITPHARVVVRGTTLSLVNSPEATRVDLEEGKVELTRRSDGQKVEVAAGSYSIVRPAPESIASRPLPPLNTKPRLALPENSTRVLCLTFSPNGKALATGGRDGWIQIWDPRGDDQQQPIAFLAHPKNEVRALAYSPDSLSLAIGGDENHTTKIADPADGSVHTTLKGLRTWIEALAYTPDGRTLVVAGAHGQDSNRVKVWDLIHFRVQHTLTAHASGVWDAQITPDGQLLATGGRDRTAKLWGLATGELLQTLEGHMGEVLCVAISPDGRTIASGSRDKTVKLWDLATGQEKVTLLGHAHDVRTVAFTPDGNSLVSGSQDGTARLWDLADFRERAIFKAGGGIWKLAISPDGKTLATGGNSKTVGLWDLP